MEYQVIITQNALLYILEKSKSLNEAKSVFLEALRGNIANNYYFCVFFCEHIQNTYKALIPKRNKPTELLPKFIKSLREMPKYVTSLNFAFCCMNGETRNNQENIYLIEALLTKDKFLICTKKEIEEFQEENKDINFIDIELLIENRNDKNWPFYYYTEFTELEMDNVKLVRILKAMHHLFNREEIKEIKISCPYVFFSKDRRALIEVLNILRYNIIPYIKKNTNIIFLSNNKSQVQMQDHIKNIFDAFKNDINSKGIKTTIKNSEEQDRRIMTNDFCYNLFHSFCGGIDFEKNIIKKSIKASINLTFVIKDPQG